MRIIVMLVCLAFTAQAWGQNPKIKEQERLEKERNFRKENKLRSQSEYKVIMDAEEVIGKKLFRQEIYDEDGFLVQVIEPQAEDSIRTVYQYNDRGFETMHTIIGMDLLPIRNSTEYDEAGRKTAGESASAELKEYKFSYDGKDALIRREGYTQDYESGEWVLADIDSFFYDKSGNITQEVSYYMDEEVWRQRSSYDEQGRLLKTEGIRSENVEITDEYTYDEKGLPATRTSTDSYGTLSFIYEYEYF